MPYFTPQTRTPANAAPVEVPGVADFVDWAWTLNSADWIEVGYALQRDLSGSKARATAVVLIEAAALHAGAVFDGWLARDAVDAAIFASARASRSWSASERGAFEAACAAASDAAVALALASFAAPHDVAALLAPFADPTVRLPAAPSADCTRF